MDTKKMLQDGFEKIQVAVLIGKDRNGKTHMVVVDTPEHAKEYKSSEDMRLATMYVKKHERTTDMTDNICDYDEGYTRWDAYDIGWCMKCKCNPNCPMKKKVEREEN